MNESVPSYFIDFFNIVPEEVIKIYKEIELSFKTINYENHYDDLDSVFNDYISYTGKDLYALINNFYREHVENVLAIQGIYVRNIFEPTIKELESLLTSVVILGTVKLSEIPDLTTDVDDSDLDYFANIVEGLTDLEFFKTLEIVSEISTGVIEYLKKDQELPFIYSDLNRMAEDRFKNCTIKHPEVILNTIRGLKSFGYGLLSFTQVHVEELQAITDADLLAREIIYSVLGSNTLNNVLLSTIYEVAEYICKDSKQLLLVNAIINKYSDQINSLTGK